MTNNPALKFLAVVPCYNEQTRLKTEAFFEALSQSPELGWVFVNDGSQDNTLAILTNLQALAPERIWVYSLETNQGKAEAVRYGLLKACEQNPTHLAYFDADLATPIDELLRLYEVQKHTQIPVVLGVRIFLQGHHIQRTLIRYLLGRGFAKVASLILKQSFQDTQCGAKVFAYTSQWPQALESPFVSKWLFDVELFYRLKRYLKYKNADFYEEPLRRWKEVGGSKIKWHSFVTALFDLIKIILKQPAK